MLGDRQPYRTAGHTLSSEDYQWRRKHCSSLCAATNAVKTSYSRLVLRPRIVALCRDGQVRRRHGQVEGLEDDAPKEVLAAHEVLQFAQARDSRTPIARDGGVPRIVVGRPLALESMCHTFVQECRLVHGCSVAAMSERSSDNQHQPAHRQREEQVGTRVLELSEVGSQGFMRSCRTPLQATTKSAMRRSTVEETREVTRTMPEMQPTCVTLAVSRPR